MRRVTSTARICTSAAAGGSEESEKGQGTRMPDRRIATWARVVLLWVALAGSGLACRGDAAVSSAPPAGPAQGRKIVLVGLDAADWLAIDPLISAGKLP